MKPNYLHFAAIGLLLGVSMSANAATENRSRALAMAKCTKSVPRENAEADSDQETPCIFKGCSSCGENGDSNEDSQDQSNAAGEVKCKRKSAAQKVLEGY